MRGAFIVDEDTNATPPRPDSPKSRSGTKDIRLPYHKANVSHLAVDVGLVNHNLRQDLVFIYQQIGGSLAKLVYFTRDPNGNGGTLNFKNFETEKIDDLIYFMARLINGKKSQSNGSSNTLFVMATGGGAYKFYDKITTELNVEIYREDEMECLIVGW